MSEELRIERDKLKVSLAQALGDIHSLHAILVSSDKKLVEAIIERDSAVAKLEDLEREIVRFRAQETK